MSPSEWVPIRWSSGPVDIATRKNVSSDEKEALSACHEPAALRILEGSPFNCLVISLAAGVAEDEAQKSTLKPLVDAAKAKGLAVLGRVTGKAVFSATQAAELGLAGIVTDTELLTASGADSGITLVREPDWPSVRMGQGGNADAGPTGAPWIDSNGWKVQLARALNPASTVWTTGEPGGGAPMRPDQYALAVADAGAYGGRWVVALDPITQAGLLKSTGEAREAWSTLTRAVKFFDAQKDWNKLGIMSRIGVVSDFTGPNEFLALEYLNLSTRRLLPARIIHSAKLTPESWHGLRALVVIGGDADRQLLIQYLTNGGMVILPPGKLADAAKRLPAAGTHENGYQLYQAEKGMVAISPEEWTDPYMVAQDAHRLLGRKNDVVRLWNSGSTIAYPTANGPRTVVHLVNYTGRPSNQLMTLYVVRPHAQARMIDLAGKVEVLKAERKNEGTEVALPVFTSYAAVEFGDKA